MLIVFAHLLGKVISKTFAEFKTNSLISKLLSIIILLSNTNYLNVYTTIEVLVTATIYRT